MYFELDHIKLQYIPNHNFNAEYHQILLCLFEVTAQKQKKDPKAINCTWYKKKIKVDFNSDIHIYSENLKYYRTPLCLL